MILCITPNPNLERTWMIPGIHLGGVFQAEEKVVLPSGKGVNVARAVRHLGGEAVCTGLLGGHTGRLLADLLEEMQISARWTWTERETRSSVAMIDPTDSGDATLISELGEPVTIQNWQDFEQDVLAASASTGFACISGSLPAGLPLDRFAQLIELLEARGIPVWVDSSGPALKASLKGKPTGIKINKKEAGALLGAPLTDLASIHAAAAALKNQGIRSVCITLGEHGAILSHENETWFAEPPRIELVSSVGSGDAFLAGLLVGFDHRESPAAALRMAAAAGAANARTPGGGRLKPEDYESILPQVQIRHIP